jgi:hypothetical protein
MPCWAEDGEAVVGGPCSCPAGEPMKGFAHLNERENREGPMRRGILTTILIAGALIPGSRLALAQTVTSQPKAAPATAQNPVTTTAASSTVTTASSTTTAAASKRTLTAAARRRRIRARIRARRLAQRRALLAQQSQAQALRNAPPPTEPAAAGSRDAEQDASLVLQQQQEQAARLTSEQQQVLHAYIKTQRQMQEEPRIQDSLGDQPPPYAPVIPPHAASQDTQGIQEAPGPAQTTPKPAPPPTQPPPSSQQNQAPPTSQPQSEPSELPQYEQLLYASAETRGNTPTGRLLQQRKSE